MKVEVNGRPITMGGVAKGVGMVAPHMATMFCFLTTDAAVAPAALRSALKRSADESFNLITIDGDQSTSDTVAILANGLAETAPLEAGRRGFRQFTRALGAVTERLALMLVEDGEGATKLVTVAVRGARSRRDARLVAQSVANSPLVKTAITGHDPNWGRFMMAIGKSAAKVEAERVAVSFEDELLVERGMLRESAKLERIRETMTRPAYTITIDLGLGRGEAHVFTCDLSEEYVRINSKYTT